MASFADGSTDWEGARAAMEQTNRQAALKRCFLLRGEWREGLELESIPKFLSIAIDFRPVFCSVAYL